MVKLGQIIILFLLYFLYAENTTIYAQTAVTSTCKDSCYIVNQIQITGNKQTKESIIKREILVHQNDTLTKSSVNVLLHKSRENLINTSLFHFVTIDTTYINNTIDITFTVIERWYLWPFPLVKMTDRNFNTWWETKDLSHFNYGIFITQENFRGRKELLKLLFTMGYDQQYTISYKKPYINKKQTLGLGVDIGFVGNHETIYNTIKNKQVSVHDKTAFIQQKKYAMFELIIRKNIYNTHTLQFQYDDYTFKDTLLKTNPLYSYKNKSQLNFLSLYYQYKNDHRDYKSYPLNGYYFDVIAIKNGLGIITKDVYDLFSVKSTYRKYYTITNRWHYAVNVTGKLSNENNPAYFIQKDLGYNNDFVRGYEYYLMNGYMWGVLKNNIKFTLIPTTIHTFKFIKTKKFNTLHYALYLNIFADAGYVKDSKYTYLNTLHNKSLIGTGIGLDYVTYYDKVLRLEIAVNQLKEIGFFIHFVAPI